MMKIDKNIKESEEKQISEKKLGVVNGGSPPGYPFGCHNCGATCEYYETVCWNCGKNPHKRS